MYNGPFAWFYFLSASKQKQVKRAVKILTRAGLHTEQALEILSEADRNKCLPALHSISR